MGDQAVVIERGACAGTLRPRHNEPDIRRDHPRRQSPVAIQPKLLIGPADDAFEREAERTADQVTAGSRSAGIASGATRPVGPLGMAQRAIGKTEPVTKKDDDDRRLQKSSSGLCGPDVVPAALEAGIAASTTGGRPLAEPTKSLFESRFGFDFSDVRIHDDAHATGTATALGARAFTVGNHTYFGAGEYQPSTPSGRHLIAHELTHTIQQKSHAARAARLTPAPLRVQRLPGVPTSVGIEIHAEVHKSFPPWELITLLIGYDPILEKPVKGAFRDWLHAAVQLVPHGDAMFDKMDKDGRIDGLQKWWEIQVAQLDVNLDTITGLFRQAWDALEAADILDPVAAFNKKITPIFGPTVARVKNFALAVGAKVLEILKTVVLDEIREWAVTQKGYPLLTMVLRRDPVTGEPVSPTLKGLIFAVLDLVDGGDQIKDNLEKSHTIEKAAAWFKAEAAKLDITWDGVKALFIQAWDAFQATDLLNPVSLLAKMWTIFGPPVTRLLNFLAAVTRKIAELVFEGAMVLAGPVGVRIVGIVRKAGNTFSTIVDDPVAFLNHLIDGLKKGVAQFAKNIWTHLKTGVIAWLTGALEGAGVVLPKVFDLKGIVDLVLQILGISYAKIRVKLVKVLGERTVSLLEKGFAFLKTLVTEGPAAAWKEIAAALGSLWDLVIGGIKDWAVTRIVTAAVTKLATMLNPAGAVIQAIIATYDTVAFFIERINQILDFVEAIIDSIANLAAGKIAAAANWIEKAMARSIPVLLGFLARLVGLGNISEKIKKIITDLQARVDKAIDAVIAWIVAKAKAFVGAVKDAAGALVEWWKARAKFHTADGEDHEVAVTGDPSDPQIVVRSTPKEISAFLEDWQARIAALPNEAQRQQQKNAHAMAAQIATKIVELRSKLKGKPKGNAGDAERQQDAKEFNQKLKELSSALAAYHVSDTIHYPPAILPPFVSKVRATNFRSQYITKNLLDKGSRTSASNKPVSWDRVPSDFRKSGNWVRMHLLTAALGGKGADSNLVPARRETNKRLDDQVETPAYKALEKGKATAIWYEFEVDFHEDTENGLGNGFPSRVKLNWGEHSKLPDGSLQMHDNTKGPYEEKIALPNFDLPGALEINSVGRYRMSATLGISIGLSKEIIRMRSHPFKDPDDFLNRVNQKFPGKITAPDFEAKVRNPQIVTGWDAG